MSPIAVAIGLAAVLGAVVAHGYGVEAAAFALAGLLVLLIGNRLPRILGLAFLLAAVPPEAFPKVTPSYLIILGEFAVAIGVVLLGRQHLGVAALWSATAFIVLCWFAVEHSLTAGGAYLSPRFGFLAASVQLLFVSSGPSREAHDDDVFEFSQIACLIGALLGVWAIAEFALDRGLAYPLVSGARRAIGPFGNPNLFGAALAQVTVLSVALTRVMADRRRPVILGLFLTAVSGLGLLATLSRGALVAATVGCVMVLTSRVQVRRRFAVWLALGLVSIALLPVVVGEINSERIQVTPGTPIQTQELLSESVRARFLAIRLGIELTAAHPLGGVGLDRFPGIAARDPGLGVFMETHNEPIRVAAEAGIPAFAALVAVLWLVVRAVRRRTGDVRILVLPVAMTYLVGSLFLNGLEFVAMSFPCAALLFLGSGVSSGPDEAGRGRAMGSWSSALDATSEHVRPDAGARHQPA